MNFFERMERKIDFQHEYEKLEHMVCNDYLEGYHYSLDYWICHHFKEWPERQNYLDFYELRKQEGFDTELIHPRETQGTNKQITCGDFFRYSEMIINVVNGILYGNNDPDFVSSSELELKYEDYDAVDAMLTVFIDTVHYDINYFGYEFACDSGNHYLVVQNNPTASVVVEHVKPVIADAVMEYNHYVLKGNLKRKKELLKVIADDLESQRGTLKGLQCPEEDQFFNLVNNCNIRHNNFDPTGGNKYHEKLSKADDDFMENTYDLAYELGLICYLVLGRSERNEKLATIKSLY